MYDQPSEPTVFYGQPLRTRLVSFDEEPESVAVREASEREAALLRALNGPPPRKVEPPSLKKPVLPDDFASRVAQLDAQIYKRGIAVDRDKLVSLGETRFAELLEADRTARSLQRIILGDLTRWESVHERFVLAGALEVSVFPRRRNADIFTGRNAGVDQARTITGFDDLWKATAEPAVVRNVYAFRDLFDSLVFGQSMLERLADDGRMRSKFFCGGKGRKVELFNDWLKVVRQPLVSVTIADPLTACFGWLLKERLSPPVPHDFFSERLPSPHRKRYTEALWHGFLLGYDDLELWQYIGRATRWPPDMPSLTQQRMALTQRYPGVANFHQTVSAYFYRNAGENAFKFEADRYRSFIDSAVQKMLKAVSGLVALAIEETLPGCLVARFQNRSLIEKKPPKDLHEKIEKLIAAFPGAAFQVEIKELES